MKNIMYVIFGLLLIITTCFAKDVKGKTYVFNIPDDVTFETKTDMEFYSFKWGKDASIALLMFYPYPTSTSEQMLKPMIELMEIGFEYQMKKMAGIKDIKKTKRDIKAGVFSGVEIEFAVVYGDGKIIEQYMFLVWDGDRAWSGQLTAPSTDDINKAHTILEKAKKISDSVVAPSSTIDPNSTRSK